MKNRNKSLIVLAGAVTISAMFVLGRAKGSSLIATNRQNLSYGHYDTVLPSFEKPGSHEYWVCCETHEIRFEKPLEGIIYSEGAPSQEQIASWESLNDGRYIAPIVKTDASHFQYGFYPQKRVSEPSLLSDLNALTSRGASGYYELGEKYYLKNNAEPYDGVYRFDDGEAIVSGASYWFECSPIEWKILSSDNDEYFVISEKLLDVVCFNDDVLGLTNRTDYEGNSAMANSNNYKYSGIRTFLNVDFLAKSGINKGVNHHKTLVDNSTATAYGVNNPFVCENTNDEVFLLSYADTRNPSYFSVVESRCSITSDYARARGAILTDDTRHPNCGDYFTRSPGTTDADSVMMVKGDGYSEEAGSYDDLVCLRPAMMVTIPS